MLASTRAESWIVRARHTPKTSVRLFCFPYAGGGASAFNAWAGQLPPDVDICAVQLPGRETRQTEDPFISLGPMLEALAAALKPHCDMPFAFFGHCLGALVAFELARRLEGSHRGRLRHLFVAGCRAPQLLTSERAIHKLPERDFVARLRELKQTPEEVLQNTELLSLFLPLLRADFGVWETYFYSDGEPLACPISAFAGSEERELNPEGLQRWHVQTRSAFTARRLPGDHFFLHGSRTLLLRFITEDLRRTLRQG